MFVNIIVVKNNMVQECLLCANIKEAESVFVLKCSEYLPHFKKVTAGDIETMLDNGYADMPFGGVFITHPEVIPTKP